MWRNAGQRGNCWICCMVEAMVTCTSTCWFTLVSCTSIEPISYSWPLEYCDLVIIDDVKDGHVQKTFNNFPHRCCPVRKGHPVVIEALHNVWRAVRARKVACPEGECVPGRTNRSIRRSTAVDEQETEVVSPSGRPTTTNSVQPIWAAAALAWWWSGSQRRFLQIHFTQLAFYESPGYLRPLITNLCFVPWNLNNTSTVSPIMYGYVAVLAFAIYVLVRFVIYPVVVYIYDAKGLRKYPNLSFVSGITNIPYMILSSHGRRSETLSQLHQTHPIIRVGPNTLSFGDCRAIKVGNGRIQMIFCWRSAGYLWPQ